MSSDDDLLTAFCDADENWGFLLFLRPLRHESIGALRALAAAVLLGLPLGLLGSILVAVVARELGKSPPDLFVFPAALIAVYFLAGWLTVFRAWNRRAARLSRDR